MGRCIRADTESGSLLKNDSSWTNTRLWRLKEAEENANNRYRLWERFKVPARQDQKLFIEGYAEFYEGSGADFAEIDDYLGHSKEVIDNPVSKNTRLNSATLQKTI